MSNPDRGAGGGGGLDESKGKAAKGGAETADPGSDSPGGLDPKMLATRRIIGAARHFNRAHPELVMTFDKLTDGTAKKGIRAIMAWQQSHGCAPADGKIGPKTVEAAKTHKKGKGGEEKQSAEDDTTAVNLFEGEEADDGPAIENPELLDNIADGAVHGERAKEDRLGAGLEHGGEAAQRTAEGLHELAGVGETPWMKAAAAPEIINLLKHGEIGQAAWKLGRQFSATEVIEGLTHAAEKAGLEISEHVLATAAKWALGLDVAAALFEWTYEGFKQIHEAHEAGDRESRIRMYTRAFADAFLYGAEAEGGMAGAVTPEQKEAVKLGLQDGSKSAGRTGLEAQAMGRALLRKYGSADGARRGIMDMLGQKLGVPAVWNE